jgi:PAS domain S-box-containing protein
MGTTCLAWLRDVPLEDETVRGNAVLIQVIGSLGAAGLAVGAIVQVGGPGAFAPGGAVPLLASAALLAAGTILVRFGHYRSCLWIISSALFLNAALPMVSEGITYGFGFTRELIIPLVIAALLLGRRTLWMMFGVIVLIATLGAARERGLLGPAAVHPMALPPFGLFGSTVIIFFFITVIMDRFSGELHRSLAESLKRLQALKESESNLRMMIDLFPDAAITMRLDTQTFVAVSAGFTAYTGLRQDEVLDKRPLDFKLWVDLGERSRYIQTILRDGSVNNFEAQFYIRNGEIATALVQGRVFTVDGAPHLLTVLRDITEWKQTQVDRERMQEQLQHAQRLDSLGSLAGGVAHDFNNMLSGIMGFAEMLLEDEQDPTRQRYLQSILKAASRSSELTRKLLAFGRKGRNLVEPTDLRALLKESLAILRPTMSPNQEVAVDMADCPSIDADPTQIHQVILNLCINALEAMPGQGVLSLSSRSRFIEEPWAAELMLPVGHYVELQVADSGMGMTEEVKQRIFEPFFTTKNRDGISGTGLGLSTVYGIVHAHGGAIEVDSEPGQGTRFRVLFPAGRLASSKEVRPAGRPKGQGRILVVEDEDLLRDVATSALESLGYSVLTAKHGAEGTDCFRRHHEALFAVLLDLKMPVMGGKEAFQEMHRIDSEVPILICTGFGENEEVQELRSLGAIGMLSKPYRIAELAETLGALTHPEEDSDRSG